MLRSAAAPEQPDPSRKPLVGRTLPRSTAPPRAPCFHVSIWTVLVYLMLALLTLVAVVGGVVVLRRLEAQQRLREELARFEGRVDVAPRDDENST